MGLIINSFCNFLNYGLEAGDVTQEVIFRIINNKKVPDKLNFSVTAYLLKIAHNIIIEDYHKRKRMIPDELIINNHPNAELQDDDENILYDRLYKHIVTQSEVCQKLFHEFSHTDNMDQLADAMNYNSKAGASQQKKRCLDKLYDHIEREDPELAKLLKKRKKHSDDKKANKTI